MAVNPVVVECAKNTWVKVATSQIAGFVYILNDKPSAYYQTYRVTGQSAPTDLSEAVPFTDFLKIEATAAIDVYVYAKDENGSVRVDL